MRALSEVNRIASSTASALLGRARVHRAVSEPTIDSEGNEALRVIIVIESGKIHEVSGDSALDAIVRIASDLQKSEDDRFPIVESVTEDELASSDDTES
jgi:hypothetical protein